MTVGVLVSSVAMDRLGRRWAHLLFALPNLAGWLCMYFGTNISTLMIGRIASGVSSGAAFIIGSVAVGEYSSPEYRGLFLNLKTTSLVVGSMTLHAITYYFHWRTLALISALPCFLGVCINCTWPESPFWLASRNQFKKSEKAFFWLRGKSEKAVKEFEALLRAQKERAAAKVSRNVPYKTRIVNFIKKFGEKDFYKPVLIIIVSYLLLDATGRHYFPAFAADIMDDMFKDKSESYLYTVVIDFLSLASCFVACLLVKVFRRRTLLFFSGITSIVVLLTISLYLFLISLGTVSGDSKVLPALLIIYFIVVNCGCTGIPIILFGEVFPLPHRESGSGIAGALTTVILTIFFKLTPILMATVNVYGMFAIYALVMALSLLYLYFALPETTNRTLQEIGDYFNHGKFLNTDHLHDDVVNVSLLEKTNTDIPE